MKTIQFQDDRVIVDGVPYYREQPELFKAKKVLGKIEWIKHDIKTGLNDAQDLYDSVKNGGLTFNTIEAEGYLRAYKNVWDLIEHIEKSNDE